MSKFLRQTSCTQKYYYFINVLFMNAYYYQYLLFITNFLVNILALSSKCIALLPMQNHQ